MLTYSARSLSVLLIVGFFVALSESEIGAQGKKKTKSDPAPAPFTTSDSEETKGKPALESDNLPAGAYRGELTRLPNEGGLFRVSVQYQRLRIRPGKEAAYDRLQKDMVAQAARSAANQTRATVRAQLTPTFVIGRTGRIVSLPDRRDISNAVGYAVGSAVTFQGESALLKELVEFVNDSQEFKFRAAPTVKVRVLKPSDDSDSTESGTKKLPGYAGKLADLKIGQHVLLQLWPANTEGNLKGVSPGSIYRRLTSLIVVEEEAEPSKP